MTWVFMEACVTIRMIQGVYYLNLGYLRIMLGVFLYVFINLNEIEVFHDTIFFIDVKI